jgi:N-acetylglucosaminyl-diphospho-decaprenol L-rhamnosyltransferase
MTILMSDVSPPRVTVSVVSHGHGSMVSDLLEDLSGMLDVASVLLTLNVAEAPPKIPVRLRQRLTIIENSLPKGFAANHNTAFLHCQTPYFCVLNPDIRISLNPFSKLIEALVVHNAGMAAPSVRNPAGEIEDSARYFPTFTQLLSKLFGASDGRIQIQGENPQVIDWAAGMFMLFKSDVFRKIEGFDEGYFLYYEDVDISARLWKEGRSVVLHPGVTVIHYAQRASRRNLHHMIWHLSSLARYFYKHAWRLPLRKVRI